MTEKSGVFSLSEIQNVTVIAFSGYITGEVLAEVHKAVEDCFKKGSKGFIFNFQDCRVINSLAIGSLLHLSLKILDDYCCKVAIANLDSMKLSVLKLVGVVPLVQVFQTLDDAVSSVL